MMSATFSVFWLLDLVCFLMVSDIFTGKLDLEWEVNHGIKDTTETVGEKTFFC